MNQLETLTSQLDIEFGNVHVLQIIFTNGPHSIQIGDIKVPSLLRGNTHMHLARKASFRLIHSPCFDCLVVMATPCQI